MRSVVAVCGDPGGANAVAPVLHLLAKDGRVAVRPRPYNEAASLWTQDGIEIEELPSTLGRGEIINLMRDPSIGLLLTGTSMNALEFEKQFIAVSRELGLAALAVLDFWANYRTRFSNTGNALIYLPDRIAVMDEQARRQMVAEGIDPALLVVTGQPAFDDLPRSRDAFTAEKSARTREELNVGPEDLLVIFASQPLGRLFGSDISNPRYLGYDEQKVLTNLIAVLERISTRSARPITLAIRPHPRETAGSFSQFQSARVNIRVSTNVSSRDILMSADLVTGMNSNLLVEGCYLGCIVASLQPGLRGPDALPTNQMGFSQAIYNEEDVESQITRLLLDDSAREAMRSRLKEIQPAGGAARRVVDLVYQMMEADDGGR
jgi:hypothetical protein